MDDAQLLHVQIRRQYGHHSELQARGIQNAQNVDGHTDRTQYPPVCLHFELEILIMRHVVAKLRRSCGSIGWISTG